MRVHVYVAVYNTAQGLVPGVWALHTVMVNVPACAQRYTVVWCTVQPSQTLIRCTSLFLRCTGVKSIFLESAHQDYPDWILFT